MGQPPVWGSAQDACVGDSLCSYIVQKADNRPWVGALVGLALGMLLFFPGFFISEPYSVTNKDYLTLTDPRELPWAIYYHLIYSPFIWFCYVWQPQAIAAMLNRLFGEHFLSQAHTGRLPTLSLGRLGKFLRRVPNLLSPASLNNRRLFGLLLLLMFIAGTLINVLNFSHQCEVIPGCYENDSHWIYQSEYYYYIVWSPLVAAQVVLAAAIALRQFILTLYVSRLLREHDLRPIPFHPDACGGLAFVGNFTVRTALIAIWYGFSLSLAIVVPFFFGGQPPLNWLLWTAILLTLTCAPLFFLWPMWTVHKALEKAKTSKELTKPSERLRDFVYPKDPGATVPWVDYDSLVRDSELAIYLNAAFGTWPVPKLTGLGFIIAYVAPILIGLASLAQK